MEEEEGVDEEEGAEEEEGNSQENQLVVVEMMVLLSAVGDGMTVLELSAFVCCGMVKVIVRFLNSVTFLQRWKSRCCILHVAVFFFFFSILPSFRTCSRLDQKRNANFLLLHFGWDKQVNESLSSSIK